MKILGDKLFRGSGAAVVKMGNWVLKIPFLMGAIKEILQEKNKLSLVNTDEHFLQYLPNFYFFIFFQASRYFEPIFFHPEKDRLMADYFKKAFVESSHWGTISLEKLSTEFLNFISQNIPSENDFWINFLKTIKIPQSSCHGDFFLENILAEKNGKLYFIDWSRFNNISSRYFDFLDYYIFSFKETGERWIKVWEKKFNSRIDKFFGIEITSELMLAYAVWKINEELKILKLRKKMDHYKKEKYIKIIDMLRSIIIKKESNEN